VGTGPSRRRVQTGFNQRLAGLDAASDTLSDAAFGFQGDDTGSGFGAITVLKRSLHCPERIFVHSYDYAWGMRGVASFWVTWVTW